MTLSSVTSEVDNLIARHARLTGAVELLIKSLLDQAGVKYLAVTGRTKEKSSILDKVKRKKYKSLNSLTDISGIRVIVYFEPDASKATEVLKAAIHVDESNSSNKDAILGVNQIGYRSIHIVGQLGDERRKLPEYSGIGSLKFEVQVRTVLQHAWAELSHDSNYKLSVGLPPSIERKLFLYAGMLEIADAGFTSIVEEIDAYKSSYRQLDAKGISKTPLNTLSLTEFIGKWAAENSFILGASPDRWSLGDLVKELKQFGVVTIKDLIEIIPRNYAEVSKRFQEDTNIYGLVRDWMLIKDWRRFYRDVEFSWNVVPGEEPVLTEILGFDEIKALMAVFHPHGEDY